MKLVRHFVASFILVSVLIGLFIVIYNDGLVARYNIEKGDEQHITFENGSYGGARSYNGTIIEQFEGMNLVEGIADITNAIQKIGSPSNVFDLLGGLSFLGIGVLKTIAGLITAPYTIANIIIVYYTRSEIAGILTGIATMVAVYMFFILLSAYLRQDV